MTDSLIISTWDRDIFHGTDNNLILGSDSIKDWGWCKQEDDQ